MRGTPEERSRVVDPAGVRPDGAYVLYWMSAARRLEWSHALDRAVALAGALNRPLLLVEPLLLDHPWASDRHHRAVLDGMAKHRDRLAGHPIGYYPYVEPEPGAAVGLRTALARDAAAVVTDAPALPEDRPTTASFGSPGCRVEAIDGLGLLPRSEADRSFVSAYQFRRLLQKRLLGHLGDRPDADPLETASDLPRYGDEAPLELDRWPAASPELLKNGDALRGLPIDHGVAPTDWRGGAAAARARLQDFLQDGLSRYADERRDPDSGASSGLSPWLHHGHISTHEVFDAVTSAEGWTPARVTGKADGRRSGWWGMSPGAEAFVDELITWRELGHVFCAQEAGYADFDTLPGWARQTLEDHASDPREHEYSLDRFAAADTHDPLWNAAQRQLLEEGVIHNYLRMLWGKKILEWSAHPREALETMIELNDRYALDGCDPNSYSGITWVLGRFDRGWPERAVYGKVRSMSSASTRRKVKLDRYLERWGTAG